MVLTQWPFVLLLIFLFILQVSPQGQNVGPGVTKTPRTGIEMDVLGFRLWMIIGFVLVALLVIIIILCCAFDCRIPRTKQEIDDDYQKRQLALKYAEEMNKISLKHVRMPRPAAQGRGPVQTETALDQDINMRVSRGMTQAGTPLGQHPGTLLGASSSASLGRILGNGNMRPGEAATARTLSSMQRNNGSSQQQHSEYTMVKRGTDTRQQQGNLI